MADRAPERVEVRPPLRVTSLFGRSRSALPFPLDEPGCRLVTSADGALTAALAAAGLRAPQVVLMPALHRGPEVQALRSAGLECRFYGAGDGVVPDAAELDALVDPRVGALWLSHHLGFPQDGDRWRAWCNERDLLLLEDCSHAWLAHHESGPSGSDGALAIFSLRAVLPHPVRDVLLLGRAAHAHPTRTPGLGARLVLGRLASADIAARRRANYRRLFAELGDAVPAAFAEVPDGASPYVLPLRAGRPDDLLGRLDKAGVEGVRLWTGGNSSGAHALRDTVGVPVHQELRETDLERIATAVGTRRRPTLRLELLADFDALGGAWDELTAASGNLFATREWLSTWHRHHGAGEPLLMACSTSGGRLAAILPLEVASIRGVRILRFLGHGPSDQMGPICGRDDLSLAASALRQVLARPPRRYNLFVGRHLLGPVDWARLLGATRVREVANPVLTFDGTSWEDVLATFGSKLRNEIRYDTRRLEREHDVRFRRCEDPQALERDLDVLFELHSAQWDQRSHFARHEQFHRDFAAIALTRGWLRLWTLEVDGRAVAAKHNFRYGNAEFSYQGGRDPEWRGPSLGVVNLANAMRASFEEGAREYRFLRGAERYKFRFPVVDRPLHTVARGNGPLGRVALAAGTALDESQGLHAARRALTRRSGSAGAAA